MLVVVVVVSNGVREMLHHALRVLFCIAHLGTAFVGNSQVYFGVCVRDGHQPPSSKKILERPSENCIPHPNRSFFLREFLVTRRCAAALAFPVLLVDEKEPTIHGDCLTIFLKKYLPRLPLYYLRGI